MVDEINTTTGQMFFPYIDEEKHLSTESIETLGWLAQHALEVSYCFGSGENPEQPDDGLLVLFTMQEELTPHLQPLQLPQMGENKAEQLRRLQGGYAPLHKRGTAKPLQLPQMGETTFERLKRTRGGTEDDGT